jgi:hypothetical protein
LLSSAPGSGNDCSIPRRHIRAHGGTEQPPTNARSQETNRPPLTTVWSRRRQKCVFDRSTALQVPRTLRPPGRIAASPHASLQLSLDPPAQSRTQNSPRVQAGEGHFAHSKTQTHGVARARCKTGSSVRGEQHKRTPSGATSERSSHAGSMHCTILDAHCVRTRFDHPLAPSGNRTGGGLQMSGDGRRRAH